MSIATDEARKESHRRCLEGCVAPAQFAFQEGYIAGRTADTTDREVDAAAFAMWRLDRAMEVPSLSGYDFETEWAELSPPAQGEYRVRASVAFSAAWEAAWETVSE